MKLLIVPVALIGALALSACERTVVTPPNATVITPPAVIATTPVPGPSGPPGPQGKPGDTVVNVVPVPSEPAKN